MAAPPRGRASTIGTAALKSVPLSAAVLMWNSWGCISVQKAWNERDSAEEVLSPSNVEPFQRRAWEQVRAHTPCEFLSIPWFQLSSSEVPQRGWRKPGWAECPSQNGWSGPQQYLWDAAYSGRTAGDAPTTYCPDRKVIQQRHNRRLALPCRMDEEG